MRHTDVAIVGGGLAGSVTAAMLGRAGIDAVLIDPHASYPIDFRCEKLDAFQINTLQQAGLAEAVLREATPANGCWVARAGHHLDTLPGVIQHGVMYDTLVNSVRAQSAGGVPLIEAKLVDIATSADRQTLKLSNGEEISARLAVLSTGLNLGVLHKLGIARRVISPAHSISVGFDMVPTGRAAFAFPSFTYFAEKPDDRMAYMTMFPVGSTMRVNLFAYRDLHDPWFKALREAPAATLFGMWPGLRKLTGDFTVPGFIKVRPVDLYESESHHQDGIVLLGDAFATSCPAAGTGARKALVDAERLGNEHIARWLATPGMSADKIASFYADPAKIACDTYSKRKAFELRSCSIDPGLRWAAMRWSKVLLQAGKGVLHALRAGAKAVEEHDGFDAPARPLAAPK